MSNAIDKYIESKRNLAQFNSWAGLIGREYFGGTRGRGCEFGKVTTASGKLEIYHQEYDGAKNYHELDPKFSLLLGKAMIKHSKILIDEIRIQLENELREDTAKAQKLIEELQIGKELITS